MAYKILRRRDFVDPVSGVESSLDLVKFDDGTYMVNPMIGGEIDYAHVKSDKPFMSKTTMDKQEAEEFFNLIASELQAREPFERTKSGIRIDLSRGRPIFWQEKLE